MEAKTPYPVYAKIADLLANIRCPSGHVYQNGLLKGACQFWHDVEASEYAGLARMMEIHFELQKLYADIEQDDHQLNAMFGATHVRRLVSYALLATTNLYGNPSDSVLNTALDSLQTLDQVDAFEIGYFKQYPLSSILRAALNSEHEDRDRTRRIFFEILDLVGDARFFQKECLKIAQNEEMLTALEWAGQEELRRLICKEGLKSIVNDVMQTYEGRHVL